MKYLSICVCAIMYVCFFWACSTSVKPKTLSDKEWKAYRLSIDTKVLFAPQNATMIFDTQQNRIYGNTGCNNYTANIQVEQNKLIITKRTFTRKLCESQEVMDYEFAFLRSLEGEYDIITLQEYKDRLSTYGQITNPDLYDSKVSQNMLILASRFKAYFLIP
ncbi:META domain-containing protein [Helicobacter equorum]|uniref:META domain-containing protein n=1 Tax=Helicobacter equorum TaxID=361872 RepID=UPI000CF1610C|nr:META domain-containing protein [Helicobacter equorum]